jgi:hypothetical protein
VIAKIGSAVKVRVAMQDKSAGIIDMQAVIIDAGPPGIIGAWARTIEPAGHWLLVRKAKDGTLYAVEGDRG